MQGGVDQGICVFYSKLSYRRKFIRNLWVGAVGTPIIVALQMLGTLPEMLSNFGVPNPVLVGWSWIGVCVILCIAGVWYTYSRWQAEKRQTCTGSNHGA